MGTDNIFKRQKNIRIKRKENVLKQKSSEWLVVCEGVETEVNYFLGAVESINSKLKKEDKLKVKVVGQGMNTKSLVSSVEDLINKIDKLRFKTIPYGKIFVVFDKDSFNKNNFDEAIRMCEKYKYIPLWSNQAIEYWFILHFNYVEGKIDRSIYKQKLNEYFKKAGLEYKYHKNDKEIYNKLCKYGSLEKAMVNAIKIHETHASISPSESESCTTVYKFFESVEERINELK